jgi:hypothetical protein
MTFEIHAAVGMSMMVLWVVTPSGLADSYQRFGGTRCLNLQVITYSTVLFFCGVKHCKLVGRYQRFGETQPTVSTVRAEVAMLGRGEIYVGSDYIKSLVP